MMGQPSIPGDARPGFLASAVDPVDRVQAIVRATMTTA
jgi:hypothetical protein